MIFALAGVVGVEPWRFTLWELGTMAQRRQFAEWDRTATILAMLHNTNTKPANHLSPAAFNLARIAATPPRRLTKEETGDLLVSTFFPNPPGIEFRQIQ